MYEPHFLAVQQEVVKVWLVLHLVFQFDSLRFSDKDDPAVSLILRLQDSPHAGRCLDVAVVELYLLQD